jgi:hypothetical protein
MNMKNAKIVYEGVEVATISCSEDGLVIKHTAEGKKMCKGGHCEC